jgi:hypothetical protein
VKLQLAGEGGIFARTYEAETATREGPDFPPGITLNLRAESKHSLKYYFVLITNKCKSGDDALSSGHRQPAVKACKVNAFRLVVDGFGVVYFLACSGFAFFILV